MFRSAFAVLVCALALGAPAAAAPCATRSSACAQAGALHAVPAARPPGADESLVLWLVPLAVLACIAVLALAADARQH